MICQDFAKKTSGAVTPMMLFFTIVFLIFGGMAIDVSNAYRMRTAMQATADAAAIAAAQDLPNQAAAKATVAAYVEMNMPYASYGDLSKVTDVAIGNWNPVTKVFDINGAPLNSVKVKLVRATDRGNPLQTHLLQFAGVNSWNIGTNAVAMSSGGAPPCVGMISNAYVDLNMTNLIGPGFCIYGRKYIKAGSSFTAQAGSELMTLNAGGAAHPIDFRPGSELINNADMLTGDIKPERALVVKATIAGWIADAKAGRAAPSGYTFKLMPSDSPPSTWQNNTIYLYKSGMSFGSDTLVANNVIIAVTKNMDFGSNAKITLPPGQDCSVVNPIGIFAGGEIKLGSKSNLDGVDIISGANVDLGENGTNKGVIIEAVKEINTGSKSSFKVCKQLTVIPGGGGGVGGQLALVQ